MYYKGSNYFICYFFFNVPFYLIFSALTNPKVKNENLTTKSIIKKEIANKFGNHDFDNFQRVTRRNSLLEKPSGTLFPYIVFG